MCEGLSIQTKYPTSLWCCLATTTTSTTTTITIDQSLGGDEERVRSAAAEDQSRSCEASRSSLLAGMRYLVCTWYAAPPITTCGTTIATSNRLLYPARLNPTHTHHIQTISTPPSRTHCEFQVRHRVGSLDRIAALFLLMLPADDAANKHTPRAMCLVNVVNARYTDAAAAAPYSGGIIGILWGWR